MVIVKKITNREEFEKVVNAAIEDNDNMQYPTHALYKDGKIVGSWCLGGIPLTMHWAHSKLFTARDSIIMNATMDSMMDDRGSSSYLMACNKNSPYHSHMEKFGYKKGWDTTLFYKDLKLRTGEDK